MPEADWGIGPSTAPNIAKPYFPLAPVPSFAETMSAAWYQENSMQALVNFMRRPVYTPTAGFNLQERLKEENLWDWDRDSFIGVKSEEELQYRIQKLNLERKRRQTLAAAGWGGIAAGMTMGIIDPTIAIPILGPAARAGRAGEAFLYGSGSMMIASGLQEGILYADQQERSAWDAAFAISAGTVLGGVIGGAAGLIARKEFDRMAANMVNSIDPPTVTGMHRYSNSANEAPGSAAATIDLNNMPGGWKRLAMVGGLGGWLGPVFGTVGQARSKWLRWGGGQFADAGLERVGMAEGKIAAEGGYIEDNFLGYTAYVGQVNDTVKDAWLKYHFDQKVPRLLPGTRALVGSYTNRAVGEMDEVEFRKEIFLASISGDKHSVPEIAAAAASLRGVYDEILQRAVDVGTFDELNKVFGMGPEELIEKLKGDMSYGFRVYNNKAIIMFYDEWMNMLEANAKKELKAQFDEQIMKHKEATKIEMQLAEDLEKPQHEIDALREQLKEELKTLNDDLDPDLKDIMDEIEQLSEEMAGVEDVPSKIVNGQVVVGRSAREQVAEINKKRKELKKIGGEPLAEFRKQRAALNRRAQNLSKAEVVLAEQQMKKFNRIDRLEELMLGTMNRVVRRSQRYLQEIASMTDKQWAKRTGTVRKMFEEAIGRMEKAEARRSKIMQSDRDPDGDRLWDQDIVVENRTRRVRELYSRLDELDSFDRAGWSQLIQDGMNEILQQTIELNAKRSARMVRLAEQAKKLDPAKTSQYVADMLGKATTRAAKIRENFMPVAEHIDLEGGTANFDQAAKDMAGEVTDHILGNEKRVALFDLVQSGVRGPAKARMLNIPTKNMLKFLETDVVRVMTNYVRTLGADIEISRKFKSPSAKWLFEKIAKEERDNMRAVEQAVDKKGEPRSEEWKQEERLKIEKAYRQGREDINTMLRRIKGVQPPGQDPRAVSARMATSIRQVMYLDQMNAVLLASIVDPGQIIRRYGLLKTMALPIRALTGQLKQLKMSAHEAKLAGTAWDWTLHSRQQALYDVFDNLHYGTKIERGVEWLSSKVGRIGLFDQWTSIGKQAAAILENELVLDAVKTFVTGKGSKKRINKAIKELARRNIDRKNAEIIYEQSERAGGNVNGVLLPETEAWDITRPEVREARRVYRAALGGTLEDTIITPGVERMAWQDSSQTGKMISQFRSFGIASTTKTLLANLQQADMKAFNGIMVSLGLGMVGYYLSAVSKGGQAEQEMRNADIGKWIDEAIIRSGQLGMLEDVMRVAQRTPLTAPYASFSGTRSGRRKEGNLVDMFAGPWLDTADKVNAVIMGMDDPTAHTLHMLRQLLPFQNHFLLRRWFDALEEDINLPERRR